MVYKFRNKMKPFSDLFFMAYFLPLACCVAMGISSNYFIYKLCLLIGLLFLSIKVWLTDYKKNEIIIIMLFLTLLGYVFYRTREKSLVITIISIIGCKNVEIKKVLKYTLIIYILGFSFRMGLSWLNILPGKYFVISKNGIEQVIYDFGFSHPNSAYNHILMMIIMTVAVWGKKILWYHYVLMTIIMFLFYYLFFSRTGIFTYLILCLLLLILINVRSNRMKKKISLLFLLIPFCITFISYLLLFLYPFNISFIDRLNKYLTRRIEISCYAVNISGINLFGSLNKSWINNHYVDNAYISLLINYGIIIIILCMIFYLISAIYYWKKEDYYVLIILATMSIYAFMEYSPVNVTWNPILLFIGEGLFSMFNNHIFKSDYDA